MTRFDFSPGFRTLLDFALLLRLIDGVEIAAMTTQGPNWGSRPLENFILEEIDGAAEARTHSDPEIRRLWNSARSRCKAIVRESQRTGRGSIDESEFLRVDYRLGELWRESRIEAL